MIQKFHDRVERLISKIGASATPVPGFIVGLSGTDSIVAFLMCHEALRLHGMAHRLYGIHYVSEGRRKPSWFEEHVIPWLRDKCPEARIEVLSPLGGNHDQCRWADLQIRALNEITKSEDGYPSIRVRDFGENYWVVGTINATERFLGTYSLSADCASIQPLHTLNKSTILAICAELEVPEIARHYARQPDCFCGRDEIASQNIELIDGIIANDFDALTTPAPLLDTCLAYVRENVSMNGFKARIPYIV